MSKNEKTPKNIDNLHDFVARVDELKKMDKADLSSDQDLSIALMNLIGIEEHFFFSGAKTGNNKYYDLIKEVRDMRKVLLAKLVVAPDGEEWCISKHLLAAAYRLFEVGCKQLDREKKEEAYDFFNKSYELYSLFWGINMKLLSLGDVQKIDDEALNKHDPAVKITDGDATEGGIIGKLKGLVKKVVNCCIE